MADAAVAAAQAQQGVSAWDLLVTSASPTLVVCLLASVGVALAKKGILTPANCQLLARIGFLVYAPALTFSKMTQAVSLDSIRHLWPLVVTVSAGILVGLALGAAACRLLRAPPEFRTHALVAIAFGNVGQLPLVFVTALCHDGRAVFRRSLGDSCERLGIAYTAFDIAVATLFQFTIAINMLRRCAAASAAAAAGDAEQPGTPGGSVEDGHGGGGGGGGGLKGHVPPLQKHPTLSDLLQGRRGSRPGSASSTQPPSPADPGSQQAQQAQQAQQGASPLGAAAHVHVVELQPQAAWPHHRHAEAAEAADAADTAALLGGKPGLDASSDGGIEERQHGGGSVGRRLRAAWRWLAAVEWRQLVHMPIVAAVAACVVGCIAPAKGLLYGRDPPLRLVADALDTLSGALIPVSLPLLGAVLSRGPGASRMPLRVTLGVLAARLVVLPTLMTGFVLAALALGLFSVPDPMFLLTLLLSNATPTAINIQSMAVLYRTGEAEVSTMLFIQYLAAMLTLPAWVAAFLRIIERWA